MSNRVTHFEIPCDDPITTVKFFKTVFGWTFEKYGEYDYWFATTGDDDQSGINGAVTKRQNPGQPIANSITVKDIDKKAKEIERAGGQVVVPKTAVKNTGWIAFFKDPDGNIHGIWEEDKNAK
ncbi:MAG: VOC family protein [Crocinitomicaceae bacterium]